MSKTQKEATKLTEPEIEIGSEITIRIPLREQKSSSGKMLLIGNSGGWKTTKAMYKGKEVKFNLTCGIKVD